jgi:oligopeptide/dipeptide ABC transporter ATP-binding protein|uniref:ABC transporter ATP-binding protein n=1 Tax=Candidatus Caldatribacterium californiense TaxID=1454726 RepID=A0A7V4DFC1_9BACT
MGKELLVVENLRTYIFTPRGVIRAVDGVSFTLDEEETLGLVGESGCGKSMTALSILKLYPKPQGRIVEGTIEFAGESLVEKSEKEMQRIRGKSISMIFQEPMTSLDPVFPVGEGIIEVLMVHQGLSRREAKERAIELLRMVRIPEPERRIHAYPHQLSGGMRQRVMIAQALACRPKLLIADEPTTALDVTVQAQILELIRTLKKEMKTAVLLITHDLGVVAEHCERVAVMYAGKIVEKAGVLSLFARPLHPYTRALLGALPRAESKKQRLEVIPGTVPDLLSPPPGCRFHPRCQRRIALCFAEEPPLREVEKGHEVACHLL